MDMTDAMLVLEPIFETDLPSDQYTYRPGRNAQQAAKAVEERLHRGKSDVVCAELADRSSSPGGIYTHWKSPPLQGAHPQRPDDKGKRCGRVVIPMQPLTVEYCPTIW
jgi:hypothetical protein